METLIEKNGDEKHKWRRKTDCDVPGNTEMLATTDRNGDELHEYRRNTENSAESYTEMATCLAKVRDKQKHVHLQLAQQAGQIHEHLVTAHSLYVILFKSVAMI
jgi:hypothetical protein